MSDRIKEKELTISKRSNNFDVLIALEDTRFWTIYKRQEYFYGGFISYKFIVITWGNDNKSTNFLDGNTEHPKDTIIVEHLRAHRFSGVISKCYRFICGTKRGNMSIALNKNNIRINFAFVISCHEESIKILEIERIISGDASNYFFKVILKQHRPSDLAPHAHRILSESHNRFSRKEHFVKSVCIGGVYTPAYILKDIYQFTASNWKYIFGLLIFLGGGSALSFKVPGIIEIVKNALSIKQELRGMKLDNDFKEIDLKLKRLELYERAQALGIDPEDLMSLLETLSENAASSQARPTALSDEQTTIESINLENDDLEDEQSNDTEDE